MTDDAFERYIQDLTDRMDRIAVTPMRYREMKEMVLLIDAIRDNERLARRDGDNGLRECFRTLGLVAARCVIQRLPDAMKTESNAEHLRKMMDFAEGIENAETREEADAILKEALSSRPE